MERLLLMYYDHMSDFLLKLGKWHILRFQKLHRKLYYKDGMWKK